MKHFQKRCIEWVHKCLGKRSATSTDERTQRFVEESIELAQSLGLEKECVIGLVDYVYAREPGRPTQEVGGVMVTLAALCECHGIDAEACGVAEIERVDDELVMARTRAKDKTKPR